MGFVYIFEIKIVIEILNISITSKNFLIAHCNFSFLSFPVPSPDPQAPADLLSVTIHCFTFPRIVYRWTHIVCTIFYLTLFPQHTYLAVLQYGMGRFFKNKDHAIGGESKKSLPNQRSNTFPSMYYSRCFHSFRIYI